MFSLMLKPPFLLVLLFLWGCLTRLLDQALAFYHAHAFSRAHAFPCALPAQAPAHPLTRGCTARGKGALPFSGRAPIRRCAARHILRTCATVVAS